MGRIKRRESSLERAFFRKLKKMCPKAMHRKLHNKADPDDLIFLPNAFTFLIEFKRSIDEEPVEAQELRHKEFSDLDFTILVIKNQKMADDILLMIKAFYDKHISDPEDDKV